MSTPKSSDTWSTLLESDKTANAPEGPSTWDKVASTLSGAANFASGFVAEQTHTGLQDLVSRVLYGETYHAPEPNKEPEREPEKDDGRDR